MGKPAANHPWKIKLQNQIKLKEAKALAEKRRQAKYYAENKEMCKLNALISGRKRRGIPTDLPIMRAWDYKMGRVTSPAA